MGLGRFFGRLASSDMYGTWSLCSSDFISKIVYRVQDSVAIPVPDVYKIIPEWIPRSPDMNISSL